MGAQKTDAYEVMGAQNVRIDKSEKIMRTNRESAKSVRTKQIMCRSMEEGWS